MRKHTIPHPPKTKSNRTISSGKNIQFLIVAGIILLTLMIYSKTFNFEFLNWDDNLLVYESPFVKAMAKTGFDAVKNNGKEYLENNIVTIATHAATYKTWGENPKPYHVINVLLHIINCLLVFLFIKLLTKRWEAAALVALIFALHPMRVESVAWVAERKDVLYAMFYFAGLICYVIYVQKNKIQYLFIALIFFPFALFSKFAAVTFPFALFLIDYYFNRKLSVKTILEKTPFFLLLLIAGILQFTSPNAAEAAVSVVSKYSHIDRFFFASYSFNLYFLKFFAPVQLSALYPYPIKTDGSLPGDFYFSIIIALIIIAGILLFIRYIKLNRRETIFGLLFFMLNIFLVLHFVAFGGNIVAADRYTYMAHLGLTLPLGIILCNAIDKINPFFVKYRILILVLLSAMSLLYMITTWKGIDRFQNSITLFNDVIEKNQTAGVAYSNRGLALEEKKDYANALNDYNKVIKINPEFAIGFYNRGVIKGKINDFDGALKDYTKAIKLNPAYTDAYHNRGLIESKNKRNFKAAMADFSMAIKLNINFKEAYKNRAVAAYESGDFQACLADMNKVVEIDPADNMNYFIRGHAKNNLGMKQEACNDWNIAMQKGNKEARELINKNCK